MLLNMGSLCVLSAFAVLKGGFYQYFIKELLLSDRKYYAIGYYSSIIISLYCSLVVKSYILTLIAMALEFVFLMYFICSSFPGGHTGLNYMGSFICSFVKRCFKMT
jgi:Got1/Sft2-like family